MKYRSLALATILFFAVSSWQIPALDPDLGMHLLGGAIISENQELPKQDPINTFAKSWHDYHWLAQILIYQTYKFFDYDGLRIATGLISILIAFFIFRLAELKSKNYLAVSISSISSIFLLQQVTSARPQLLAYLTIAYSLFILNKKSTKYEVIKLFLLTAITANFHVYWLFIPFLYFCLRVLRNEKHSLIKFSLLILAAAINPYGFGAYAVVLEYLTSLDVLKPYIFEFQSAFAKSDLSLIVLLLNIIVLSKFLPWRHWRSLAPKGLPIIVAFYQCVKSTKFLSILALCLPMLNTIAYAKLLKNIKLKESYHYYIHIGLLLLAILHAINTYPSLNQHAELAKEMLPFEACRKITKLNITPSAGRDHVRVLTHFNHGNWCRWLAYQEDPNFKMKVTTDSRTQWMPVTLFQDSFNIYLIKPGWLQTLSIWSPDVALVYKNGALAQTMILASNNWKLVHEDAHFALFIPINKPAA